MKSEELSQLITEEDIIQIMTNLGNEYIKNESDHIEFNTICHGGSSKKLWYYKDSGIFKCFTCCGTMSLYDLIMSVLSISFKEAFQYVANFKGIDVHSSKPKGIIKREKENTDLKFLRLHRKKIEKRNITLPTYSENILKVFDSYMPSTWFTEGISLEIAKYFEIKIYFNQKKAIIPHRDINGNLVGIRSRNFNQWQVDSGMKYMPIKVQGLTYKYPMNFNLYGIYQNKENIKKYKKVIVFESEKSVLLYGSIYGQENNISVTPKDISKSR
jgi:DNA primase